MHDVPPGILVLPETVYLLVSEEVYEACPFVHTGVLLDECRL